MMWHNQHKRKEILNLRQKTIDCKIVFDSWHVLVFCPIISSKTTWVSRLTGLSQSKPPFFIPNIYHRISDFKENYLGFRKTNAGEKTKEIHRECEIAWPSGHGNCKTIEAELPHTVYSILLTCKHYVRMKGFEHGLETTIYFVWPWVTVSQSCWGHSQQ